MIWGPVNTAATFVMSLAAAYFFLAAGLGFRQLRRHATAPAFQSCIGYGHPFVGLDDAPSVDRGVQLYFLIPCLNEAAVIGRTVAALVAPPGWDSRIVVVDDGSDDATAAVARRAGRGQVHVVSRRLADARQGKGAALNAGFAYLHADALRRRLDPDRVLVVVMDADGRLSDGAVTEVLPLFDDPTVGGVQLSVRIRNRARNFLLRFQDHQFWTLSALTQFGRISTATVSLGGNGQFTRLSALLDVGEKPWTASLTEDLDLSISLATRGWRLTSTPRAAVDQQGVERLGALIRQRTRWYQGHMTAGRRLPEVLRSRRILNASAVELVLYLIVPWAFDLPWSVLYHLILAEIAMTAQRSGLLSGSPLEMALSAALWYLLCFWPALLTAIMARRRDPANTWYRALKLGHCFVATNYLSYVCAWRALYRIACRHTGWVKTARTAEPGALRADAAPRQQPRVVARPAARRCRPQTCIRSAPRVALHRPHRPVPNARWLRPAVHGSARGPPSRATQSPPATVPITVAPARGWHGTLSRRPRAKNQPTNPIPERQLACMH